MQYGLLFLLGGILVFGVAILVLWRRAASLLGQFFGTANLKRIEADSRLSESNTPKSLSTMTGLLLPRIQRDFPEFSWPDARARCMDALRSSLLAVSERSVEPLNGESGRLLEQLRLRIEADRAAGERTIYREVTVHGAELAGYDLREGLAIVTVRLAAGFFEWRETDGGELLSGDTEYRRQTRFEMELVYLRDASEADAPGLGLTCPRCGAPVTSLGQKSCVYCGTGVIPVNDKVWSLGRIREI